MRSSLRRAMEILPGSITWLTIVAPIIGAVYFPRQTALVILIYVIYWLVRIVIMTGYLIAGFRQYRLQIAVDWHARLKRDFPGRYQEIRHLVIVPTYKEDISILRRTLDSLRRSDYPSRHLWVVVAFEAREKVFGPSYSQVLTREYEHSFGHFITTFHPGDIPGEVKGKGPNITWAARRAKEWIDTQKIPYDRIITTTLDADNRVDPKYFANLTWLYLRDPDPLHKSFQPLPMFFNNIWQVPLPVKMTALGSSFWQMIQAMRPHYARNFAAHAQSFAALVKTDFWSVTTVVEDGHQYWRTYFRFDGNHRVVPIFVPVYMDAVQGVSMFNTFREQYLQRRRWFWGVSDVPYVFEHSLANGRIPWLYKWLQFGRLFESHWSLATQSFVLLFGWLPVVLNSSFQGSVLFYNFPILYRNFLFAAWIGMIASMTVASSIVPPRPGPRYVHALYLLREWILAPIMLSWTAITFSALPAVDSQTRLLLKKPFTVFNVTPKTAVPSGTLTIEK